MSTNAKSQIQRLGWRIRYVPHDVIEDYNATYNVEYEGKNVVTDAAKELGIPLNEIWISELWKPYEKYLLHHEVREIQYRAAGLSQEEAHEKAVRDDRTYWKDDASYRESVRRLKAMDRETALRKAANDSTGDRS